MNYITQHYKNKCDELNFRKQNLLAQREKLDESLRVILQPIINRLRAMGRYIWDDVLQKWVWSGPKPEIPVPPPETATGYDDEIMAWYDRFMRDPANQDRWGEINDFAEIVDWYDNPNKIKNLNEYYNIVPTVLNVARSLGRGFLDDLLNPWSAMNTFEQLRPIDEFDTGYTIDQYGNKLPPYPAPEGFVWEQMPNVFDPSRFTWFLRPRINAPPPPPPSPPPGGVPSMYDLYFQDTNEPRTFGTTKA